MTKLLIADDEMLVLVGLKSMIDWAALDIDIVGIAHNGTQTLEMTDSLKPDIILLDINMPVKNGLDVARECRIKYGKLPAFIFLTSYEEFSFAREAVSVQALDYLVKISLTPEQLEAAMKKAIQSVQEIKAKSGNSVPDTCHNSSLSQFHDRFFLQLFNNGFKNESEFREQAKEIDLQFNSRQFTVVLCETIMKQNRSFSQSAYTRLYSSTIQTAQSTVSKYTPCYVTGLDIKHFAITLLLPESDNETFRNTVETLIAKLQEVVFGYFSVELYCTAGIPVTTPMQISVSYQSARMTASNTKDKPPCIFAPNQKNQTHQERVVTQVQDYIRNNITKRLSLNDVAKVFGFTPNYLSQMFAKSGTTGFVEYVTNEKVAAAKKMLETDSSLLVYELADKIGFESAFYFSTVFKKVTGCSPSEYRDRVTEKQR